jgi:hypothetical protein
VIIVLDLEGGKKSKKMTPPPEREEGVKKTNASHKLPRRETKLCKGVK